jgi:hypothetical protein
MSGNDEYGNYLWSQRGNVLWTGWNWRRFWHLSRASVQKSVIEFSVWSRKDYDSFLSKISNLGFRLAKGESLPAILATLGGVSEGVNTILALEQLIKTKVKANNFDFKFPIFAGVAKIIRGQLTPQAGLEALMRYPLYAETTK